MKYRSNFICTSESEIEVGKQYQYYESLPLTIMDVTVIEDRSTEKEVLLNLRVDKVHVPQNSKTGHTFAFGYAREFSRIAYAGMARLYDLGTYV